LVNGRPNPPTPFPTRSGGAGKPLPEKTFIPYTSLSSEERAGVRSGRGLGRGLFLEEPTESLRVRVFIDL